MAPPLTQTLKTDFRPQRVIQPFYTGGKVALDAGGRILVATLGEDVVVVDFCSGQEVARLEGDSELVTTLALTPDASHLAVCSRSTTMRIYALSPDTAGATVSVTPTLQRSVKAHTAPIIVADTDPTGTLLAVGAADGTVKVWDIRGGFVTHTLRGHGGVVSALRFYAPEGKGKGWRLASAADDAKVRVWDLESGGCVAVLEAHVSVVRGLDWAQGGQTLVSAGRDRVVCVWDARGWGLKGTIPVLEELETVGFLGAGALRVEGAEEAAGESVIYMGGRGNRVRLWDLKAGKEITQTSDEDDEVDDEDREADGIVDIIYHKSLPFLLSIHNDQTLLVNSLTLPSPSTSTTDIALPVTRRLSGHHDEIIDLAYITPTDTLIALATNSEDVRIVDLTKGSGDVGVLRGHADIVICLDRDHTGSWLATGGKDNEARLWHVDGEFACHCRFVGHAESIGAIAVSRAAPQQADSSSAPPRFVLTGSQDRTIKRWDVPAAPGRRAKAVYTRKAHDKDINAIDVSPDDELFASASQDKTVKIWSVREGEALGVLRGHRRGVWSVRFGPAGAVVGGKGGRVVVTGSGDKTVRLWSLADYSCLRTFEGHTNSVLKTVWMSGGLQVASSGGDGLVKVWDVRSGECSATLDNHEDKVWALTVRKDDQMLVSGGGDSTVTFWEDITPLKRLEASTHAATLIEQEQRLQNHIHAGDYRSAITLALSLNHPGRLLSLLTAVAATSPAEPGSVMGLRAVDEVLAALGDEQLAALLARVRDWNTSARNAQVAQRVLGLLVRRYAPARLVALRAASGVWAALESYTVRHYRRVEELVQESYVLEYTLGQMEEVAGGEGVSVGAV